MENQIGSGTTKGLLEFLDQLIEKGRASSGSVIPLKSATRQIMSSVDKDSWQDTDVRKIDIDDYVSRFGILTNGRYSSESLRAYKSRFQKAVTWYDNFLKQPGWTPPKSGSAKVSKEVPAKTPTTASTPSKPPVATITGVAEEVAVSKEANDLIAYPFPLRAGRMVNLYLPTDLTLSEAKRLGRFLEALSVDVESKD